jgi:electron transport complex protein RnfC
MWCRCGSISARRPGRLLQVGDQVLRGQMLGAPRAMSPPPCMRPTSGRVVAVEPCAVPHPSGLFDLAWSSKPTASDQSVEFQPLDWRTLDPSALRNRMREMGLAGLGGAVFPSYIKLNPAARTFIP